MAMQYLGFPVEEMQKKLDNARALMEEQNLSGLLLTATANYYYFTGIRKLADWATFTRPVFLLLPRKKEPVLYVQNFGYPECRSRSFVQDIRSFPDLMTTPLEGLVSIMKELDMDKGKVGCELGYEQRMDMPVAAFLQLKDMLPNATFVDAAQLLWQLRMVKMPYEIECMREANRIAAAAFESCFTSIHEGMTEREVARKLVASMAEHGADLPGFIIVISGTGNYDRISARPTDRIIRQGDLVWIDAGTTYKGYWTDWCRAGVVGKPSEEQRRLQAIIHETTMLGVQTVAPGVPVGDIWRACEKSMLAHGLPWSFDCGRAGHGVGLQLTEPPTIAPEDDTLLQPGMVITCEPGYCNDIGCFDIEENVLVTETGYEVLSGARRELYEIATDC